MNMIQTIRAGAAQTRKITVPLPCPFCGCDAELASKIGSRFVVCCSGEDCDTQKCGSTLDEAWDRWNMRAGRGDLKLVTHT